MFWDLIATMSAYNSDESSVGKIIENFCEHYKTERCGTATEILDFSVLALTF
jgi:hypothetical protein